VDRPAEQREVLQGPQRVDAVEDICGHVALAEGIDLAPDRHILILPRRLPEAWRFVPLSDFCSVDNVII
jgi:hypothetical protein